jgi:hypothetical protein
VLNGRLPVAVLGGACLIPATAQATAINATVIPSGAFPYLSFWPNGQSQPTVSTLNAYDGAVTSNMAITTALDGYIKAFGANPAHLVLDVSGYFAR